MKRGVVVPAFWFLFLAGVAPCRGALVNISLAPGEWIVNDAHGWDDWTADYIKEVTRDGYLRITRTVANPATGWCANLRTARRYAFTAAQMEYSVFRYQWRVNGRGTYCQTSAGPQPTADGESDPWFWGPTGEITTAWSFEGSKVVADNTWLFTELVIQGDGAWSATTRYNGYGSGGLISQFSGTLTQSEYDGMGDMYLHHAFGDNYAANQYVEIAQATIEIIPEPATFVLLGFGGLALRRRHAAAGDRR